MKRTFWPAAALAAAVLVLVVPPRSALANPSACTAIGGNLVQNCGFENGLADWTQSGNESVVSGSPDFVHSGTFGVQMGEAGGFVGTYDTLSQTVSTVAGATYDIGAWHDPSALVSGDFSMTWNGAPLRNFFKNPTGSQTTASSQWVYGTATATGTGGSDTLTIGSADNTPAGIDDVSVTAAAPPPTSCNGVIGNPVPNCGFANGSTNGVSGGNLMRPVVVANNPLFIYPAIPAIRTSAANTNNKSSQTNNSSHKNDNSPQTSINPSQTSDNSSQASSNPARKSKTIPGTTADTGAANDPSGAVANDSDSQGGGTPPSDIVANSNNGLATYAPQLVDEKATTLGAGGDAVAVVPYGDTNSGGIDNVTAAPGALSASGPVHPVPEPASWTLLGTALVGFGLLRRRKGAA